MAARDCCRRVMRWRRPPPATAAGGGHDDGVDSHGVRRVRDDANTDGQLHGCQRCRGQGAAPLAERRPEEEVEQEGATVATGQGSRGEIQMLPRCRVAAHDPPTPSAYLIRNGLSSITRRAAYLCI
ncbi:unnamed protein product [Urochloa humidicola]